MNKYVESTYVSFLVSVCMCVCVLYLLDMIYVIIAHKLMWSSIINEFSCGE